MKVDNSPTPPQFGQVVFERPDSKCDFFQLFMQSNNTNSLFSLPLFVIMWPKVRYSPKAKQLFQTLNIVNL